MIARVCIIKSVTSRKFLLLQNDIDNHSADILINSASCPVTALDDFISILCSLCMFTYENVLFMLAS